MDGEISPAELHERIETGADVRIVDVRSRGSFERGHVPGSENVPFGTLPSAIERFDGADHVVTVCPHGEASVQAARLIASYEGASDARVESLAGGLEAWDYDLEQTDRAGDAAAATDDGREDGPEAPF